ncbi:MAG: hypothetical protein HY369_02370 [Candidatus Aenigmarchaeota archaeon]|nr:hypothetical protein [Candidatus Aenigmarchaeota archaeon]
MAMKAATAWRLPFGICDECGEYAKDVSYEDGEWVCRDCREYLHGEF